MAKNAQQSACALGARDPRNASDEEKVSDLHLFHLGLRPGLKSHSQSDLASSSLGRARISSLGTDAQTADLAMSTNVNIFRRLHVCSEMSTGMLRQMRENKATAADQSRQIRKVARSLELIINYRGQKSPEAGAYLLILITSSKPAIISSGGTGAPLKCKCRQRPQHVSGAGCLNCNFDRCSVQPSSACVYIIICSDATKPVYVQCRPCFSPCQHHSRQTPISRKYFTEIMQTSTSLSLASCARQLFSYTNKTRLTHTSKHANDFNKEVSSARKRTERKMDSISTRLLSHANFNRLSADYMYGGFLAISITISHCCEK